MHQRTLLSRRTSRLSVMVLAACSLCALFHAPAFAQTSQVGQIFGVVVSPTGAGIANATVTIEGTSLEVVTSPAGRFILAQAPVGPTRLVVRAPGFLDRATELDVAPGVGTAITIELQQTPNFMDQVQVTASQEPLSIGEVPAQAS